MIKGLYKFANRNLWIGLVGGVLALCVLQGVYTAATETGTWVDGNMPIMFVGNKLDSPFPESCHQDTFEYMSYTNPDGTYNSLGRRVLVNVCAKDTGLGYSVGTAASGQYIKPKTSLAFRVVNSGGSNAIINFVPNQKNFYTSENAGFAQSYLKFYDSLGQAGAFEPYNNELVYRLSSPSSGHYLMDSNGNKIAKAPPMAFSDNGEWMVVEASGLGFVRVNTTTRDMVLYDKQTYRYDLGTIPNITLAVSDDGNTVIRSGFGAGSAAGFDLSNCQPTPFVINSPSNTITGCKSRNLQDSLSIQVPGLDGIGQLRFTDSNMTARGVLAKRNASGAREYYDMTYSWNGHQPSQNSYIALGDSFSSGEGSEGTYVLGTDEGGHRIIREPTIEDILNGNGFPTEYAPYNKCHLSPNSYPYLAANSLGITDNFHSVACSAAMIEDYYGKQDGRGEVKDSPLGFWLPGYHAQYEYLKKAGKTDVVTISMVGNDIGFSDKITRCLRSDSCFHFREDRESIAKEISSKFKDLTDLYTNIKKDAGEGAKVYVLGYPKIFSTASGSTCELSVSLDPEERETAALLVRYLNDVIKTATLNTGVMYVDVTHAFQDHQLCDKDTKAKAVNGLMDGDEIFPAIGAESFHPNALGHQLLERQLLEQTQYFTSPMPPLPKTPLKAPGNEAPSYQYFVYSAPSAFTPVRIGYYIGDNLNSVFVKGSVQRITSRNTLLQPNTTFNVFFHSEPTYAGTVRTDADGYVDSDITVPNSLPPGFHTLHIYAKDVGGEEVDLYDTIYIAASQTDFDGDGVPNSEEKCLAVEPANVDEDRDGIDDACDGEIGEAPADTTAPTVTGSADREPNAAGWYNNDVTITWAATDPDPSSGTPTQPAVTVANQEGTQTYTSEPSCDPLHNCAAGSLELKIDKTAPDITYSLNHSPSATGWNNSAVTVSFACSDATSGIISCTEPQTVSGADGTYVVTGTATDNAGNSSSVNVFVSVDSTVPTITQSITPGGNAYGWHNADVTITPLCVDELSGILDCSPAITLSTEGADQTVSSSATDNANNTATATTTVNIDKTAPTLGSVAWTNNPKSTLGTATLTIPTSDNLSGVVAAEYFLGDNDPGLGNGAAMQVGDDSISVGFNTDFPTGVYKVTVRAKDKAGNWSQTTSDYLVVYDPFGTRMTGKKTLLPSLANGDKLPGLATTGQQDKATFGFNVRYADDGSMHRNSDFQFKYETGTRCGKPAQAINCHSFELNAMSIAWLTTQGTNDSTGIFQGVARLNVDGTTTNVIFRLTGLDGERLDSASPDHLTLKVYDQNDNPNIASPIYLVSDDVLRGNIKIQRW